LCEAGQSAPSPQEQILPYWTAEGGWHTELRLRNNLASGSLTVYPSVRTVDETETELDPVTIASGDVEAVDVTEALTKRAPALIGLANAYDSVVLRYNSPFMRNLFASAMVHDTGHPIMDHVDPSTWIKTPMSSSREGIWWLPSSQTKDYLILTNMADHSISGV
jgi:hypothetical protein